MDVIILAGGLGTRLREVIQDIPKPMAPIRDVPFLEHLLNWVTTVPIDNIIMAVGYKNEVIKSHFGENFKGISINYSVEDAPLGTGGAIVKALNYVKSEDVLVLNGDSYFPIDIVSFINVSRLYKSNFSVALKKMFRFDRYGTVLIDNVSHNIIQFNEKKFCEEGLINSGIYLIKRNFLEGKIFPEKFSFETEILEKEAQLGNLSGQIFEQPFIDIGIPEDYARAESIIN
ncbi:nucleotidyltransferase family protein [Arcicella lustrica]|uniref:Nucleotidyltransferase family protein n=1 Tax=Arcicella lustrica TaxID=2984196 RepID=A0ABU5SMW5_9BACT|nr:nucleotidyltransferase family protein [Arcicella sp. DC25W]MEA5428588.1 nucleotidyltransferase family protein [Arcicella sp. DC25W]